MRDVFHASLLQQSHWKANGSEPGGEQANENHARNGIQAFFFLMFFGFGKI